MLKVCILVSGGGTNLQAIIDYLKKNKNVKAEIIAVISNKKDVFALERARKENIKDILIESKDNPNFDKELFDTVSNINPDLIITAGYLKVIAEDFIKKFRNKIINVHPSLIPSFCGKGYYGLKVHEAVLDKGVKITGATVHFVDEGTDTGPIILQKAVEVLDNDTPETLQKRVMIEAEYKLLPLAIKLFAENKIKVVNNKVYTKVNS